MYTLKRNLKRLKYLYDILKSGHFIEMFINNFHNLYKESLYHSIKIIFTKVHHRPINKPAFYRPRILIE